MSTKALAGAAPAFRALVGVQPSAIRLQRVAALGLVGAAVALWLSALRGVDVRAIGDLGLVSALPPAAFAALGLMAASFALTVRDADPPTGLVLVHLATLVAMLHGATAVIYDQPGFNVVWRHAGVTDYVLSTGTIDPHIDAYFNWPGFFFLAAVAVRAAGLSSTLPLSSWAPVAFEILYLPALVVITRSFTADRRIAWTAVWLFYATNWVGQDYFSPQAMAFALYLGVVAVVLVAATRTTAPDLRRSRRAGAWLLARVRARRADVALEEVVPPAVTARQRAALVPICVVVIAAAVAAHQLTPWFLLASLAALVALRRCTARGLPVISLAVLVTWLTYLATAYLDGHLKLLVNQTADLQQTVTANVGGRLQGSAGHLFVVRMRLATTGLVWGLAAVGALRALRHGESRPSHAVLAVAPAAVGALQPYGGEMLMRVYLFTLPFMTCFAARALVPPARRPGWRAPITFAACAVALASFTFTRWGNERTTAFTAGDVRTVDELYRRAPPGSTLLAASTNVPWQSRHYADYRYALVARELRGAGPQPPAAAAVQVAHFMRHARPRRAYLVITRSQRVYDEVLGAPLWGSATALERAVERSWRFRKVFDDGDGQIFVLTRRGLRWGT